MEMNPLREIDLESPKVGDIETIAEEYSPEEVFADAIVLFPEIRQAEFNTLAAKTNVKLSKGNYYPSLSLSGGLGSG
jgi:outer membrane protein